MAAGMMQGDERSGEVVSGRVPPSDINAEKAILSEKRYNTLFTISFYPVLVFMALALSTCSGVSPELLHQHSVNSLMQVRCPISLLALKQEGCEFETTINHSSPENSEM